ncbi:hatching enzyme 1.2 isoform X2 [Alosa sapidissima]|uniref:hatching enzyme 1.2 isoform X2 n=1 Tax=Alosa sapidissima TaxID=34773 RepID=UPI001C090CB0|nr:hatching enzyme 1.2 isoform X2 [Alosa sapidissima]
MDVRAVILLFIITVQSLAVRTQRSSKMKEKRRVRRRFSDDHTMFNEMTAMDQIIEANEYERATLVTEGTTLREGDIAVSNMGGRTCFARSCLWSKSVDGHVYIAYTFSPEYNELDKKTITQGMELIEEDTCVRFVPRTHQRDYLDIKPKSGCWSYLGVRGGRQALSMQTPDCMSSGVAAHELMHALGFVHEQSRADRDNFVTIKWSNIWKDRLRNFEKFKTNNLDTPYDYGSLMHYSMYAYSEDGDPTIVPKSSWNVQMGQGYGPSRLDKVKINRLYKCG